MIIMKKHRSLVLLFLSGVFLPLPAIADETMRIRCENVEVEVPAGWLAVYTRSPQLFVLYAPLKENDVFQENMNLVSEFLPRKMDVASYMQASAKAMERVFGHIEVLETGDGFHIYAAEMDGVRFLQMQFFFVQDNTACVLTGSADTEDFSLYRDTFTAIADTVVIDGRGSEE